MTFTCRPTSSARLTCEGSCIAPARPSGLPPGGVRRVARADLRLLADAGLLIPGDHPADARAGVRQPGCAGGSGVSRRSPGDAGSCPRPRCRRTDSRDPARAAAVAHDGGGPARNRPRPPGPGASRLHPRTGTAAPGGGQAAGERPGGTGRARGPCATPVPRLPRASRRHRFPAAARARAPPRPR